MNVNDVLGDWKRSHYCGQVTAAEIGREVCLMGWVQRQIGRASCRERV